MFYSNTSITYRRECSTKTHHYLTEENVPIKRHHYHTEENVPLKHINNVQKRMIHSSTSISYRRECSTQTHQYSIEENVLLKHINNAQKRMFY